MPITRDLELPIKKVAAMEIVLRRDHDLVVGKLRRALQKIADLPLDGPIDVSIRARRIALAALGADRGVVEAVGQTEQVFGIPK